MVRVREVNGSFDLVRQAVFFERTRGRIEVASVK
jgi:hypothetical protein